MALKFQCVLFTTLMAASYAGVIQGPQLAYAPAPQAAYAPSLQLAYATAPQLKEVDHDYDPNPQYSYAYNVQDSLTGDSKSQHETREGDVVKGVYSLVDPDGHKRIVEYTADPHNGFNAVVRREPLAVKTVAQVAKIASPQAYYH